MFVWGAFYFRTIQRYLFRIKEDLESHTKLESVISEFGSGVAFTRLIDRAIVPVIPFGSGFSSAFVVGIGIAGKKVKAGMR